MKGKKQKEPAGMNPSEIFAALALLEKERGIPQSFMMEKIIQAITTAYLKDHREVENVVVDVDEEHQTLKMFVQKNVVDEEDYVDPFNEIPLAEAKALSAKYEIGDIVNIPVDNTEFGRIAAGNGKQVIIQGLREAERGMVYNEFNSKQHEILTGVVTRVDPHNGNVSLRIGTGTESTEALLMAGEQVPGEELEEGMHVKVYVVDVRRSTRGPQILISRTHPGLVKRLFELEVPEIFDGTVEVKSIAREAGSRTKMAVWSNDENVDPIGACVGPKGQRVANIVEELRGEKIDIIKWSEDPAQFIAAALAPADVVDVWMADEGKACRCVVPDDQLSLAIGKEGQNARLAARLTGFKIDIKPQSYRDSGEDEDNVEILDDDAEPAEEAPAETTEE
jgi:N utilization substance protein A